MVEQAERTGADSRGRRRVVLVLALLLVLATGIRLLGFVERDPHEDEALYAQCAKQIVLNGNFFLEGVWTSAPPVFFYVLALSYKILGIQDVATILPNLLLSVLSLLVVYRILARLHSPRAGIFGVLLLTCSHLHIVTACTTYLEPMVNLLILLSMDALLRDRPVLSGLWFGLTLATKQVAPLYAPLIAALLLNHGFNRPANGWSGRFRNLLGAGLRWTLGALCIIGPLYYWSMNLQEPRGGAFTLAYRPEALYFSWSRLLERIPGWLELLRAQLLFDWPWLVVAAVGLVLAVLAFGDLRRALRQAPERRLAVDRLIFFGFTPFFLLVLAAGQLPFWNRYVYPFIPSVFVTLGLLAEHFCCSIEAALPRRFGWRSALASGLTSCWILLACHQSALALWQQRQTGLDIRLGDHFRPPAAKRMAALLRQKMASNPAPTRLYLDFWALEWVFRSEFVGTNLTPILRSLHDEAHFQVFLDDLDRGSEPHYLILSHWGQERGQSAIDSGLLASRGIVYRKVAEQLGLTLYSFPGRDACVVGLEDLTELGLPLASDPRPDGCSGGLRTIHDGQRASLGHTDCRASFNTDLGRPNRADTWVGYLFNEPVPLQGLVFQSGLLKPGVGGWLDSLRVEVLSDAGWSPLETQSTPPYRGAEGSGFLTHCLAFPATEARGIRLIGKAPGKPGFLSVGELRPFGRRGRAAELRDLKPRDAGRKTALQPDSEGWLSWRLRRLSAVSAIGVQLPPGRVSQTLLDLRVQTLHKNRWVEVKAPQVFRSCVDPGRQECRWTWLVFPPTRTEELRFRDRKNAQLQPDEVRALGIPVLQPKPARR